MQRSVAVDDLVYDWTQHQRSVFEVLRTIIVDTDSAIAECVKYNVPFYTLNGLLMYVSPVKDGSIYLGFCQGDLMLDADGVFAPDKTKNVRKIFFPEGTTTDWDRVAAYVFEAVHINRSVRSFQKRKRPFP